MSIVLIRKFSSLIIPLISECFNDNLISNDFTFSNIWDIGTFPQGKPRRQLAYAVKQIVIQELESARIRRAAIMSGEETSNKPNEVNTSSNKNTDEQASSNHTKSKSADANLPNHLKQQLNPIAVTPTNDKVGTIYKFSGISI